MLGHLDDELNNVLSDGRSARGIPPVAVVPFLSDQYSMPAKNGVRVKVGPISRSLLRPKTLPLIANRRRWSSFRRMGPLPNFSRMT
jgi:hypothetical protein